jgi:hypothetical protein
MTFHKAHLVSFLFFFFFFEFQNSRIHKLDWNVIFKMFERVRLDRYEIHLPGHMTNQLDEIAFLSF